LNRLQAERVSVITTAYEERTAMYLLHLNTLQEMRITITDDDKMRAEAMNQEAKMMLAHITEANGTETQQLLHTEEMEKISLVQLLEGDMGDVTFFENMSSGEPL